MGKFDPVKAFNQPMQGESTITFGDNVRVRSTPHTMDRGLAGKIGQVYGQTTPSVTQVEIIGELTRDYAVNVFFGEQKQDYWFAEDLLEFVDHAPGTTIEIGGAKIVRSPDGQWNKPNPQAPKPWWKFW